MGELRQPRKPRTHGRPGGSSRAPAHEIRNICVYCGSGVGSNPAFAAAARALGKTLAEQGIGLVFGGGGRGLMGEVARATLAGGGRVTGIIPDFLAGLEHALREVDELVITDSMHERKRQMFERADAFVALPGGIGTLEEFVEQLTWNQIGQHDKPLVLANIDGYWEPLVALFAHMSRHAFIRPGLEVSFSVVDRIEDVVPILGRAVAARAESRAKRPAKAVVPDKL